jgi:hypothetical protein
LFNAYSKPLLQRVIRARRNYFDQAAPAAHRIVSIAVVNVGLIAFSFLVVHCRRIQPGAQLRAAGPC